MGRTFNSTRATPPCVPMPPFINQVPADAFISDLIRKSFSPSNNC